MKKRIRIIFCLLLTAIMLPLTACSLQQKETTLHLTILKWNETAGEGGAPIYSYESSDVPLPEDAEVISLFAMSGGKLYCKLSTPLENAAHALEELKLISMDMEGGNTAVLPLNFDDFWQTNDNRDTPKKFDTEMAPFKFVVDADGRLWMFAYESEDRSGRPPLSACRLDESGNIIQIVEDINFSILSVSFGATGNMYLSSLEEISGEDDNWIIKVVEPGGYTYDLTKTFESYSNRLVRMADGRVALVTQISEEVGREKTPTITVRVIDAENRGWDDSFVLDGSVFEELELYVYDGFGRYSMFFDDRVNLYGYDMETGAVDVLLNWKESGINTYPNIQQILTDGEYMAIAHYKTK